MSTGPTPARDTIDLARGFRFVPEDPDWIKKVLIGGVFMLLAGLLVGAVFVAGYGVRLIRRSALGEPRPLPEWDDMGGIFGDGLRAVALYLGYALPVLLVPVTFAIVVAVASTGLSHAGNHGASEAFAALARFVMLDRLSAGFEVRENLAFIRRNVTNYGMALLLYLLASFAAQLGIVLCCVGFFPASFWAFCILCWGLGEVVRRDPILAPEAGAPA